MFMTVNVDKKPMIPMVAQAIDILFHNPKDMYWTGRVMDLLFDGIPIDCSAEEFASKAICGVFESGDVKAVKKLNSTHYSFSLFSAVNVLFIFSVFFCNFINFINILIIREKNAILLGKWN